MKKLPKKAAIEMSMGTVVIIVLSVTILIFGMIFIRNIMCAGISMTDKIDEKVENEIRNLFGTSDYGVRCMGEEGQEITLGDGGRRQIACMISTADEQTYTLSVTNVEPIGNTIGTTKAEVNKWIIDKDWIKGRVSPGQKTVPVLVLDIPRGVSTTTLKITIKEIIEGTGTENTHTLYIDIKHVGQITSTIC